MICGHINRFAPALVGSYFLACSVSALGIRYRSSGNPNDSPGVKFTPAVFRSMGYPIQDQPAEHHAFTKNRDKGWFVFSAWLLALHGNNQAARRRLDYQGSPCCCNLLRRFGRCLLRGFPEGIRYLLNCCRRGFWQACLCRP